jgi:hypothetical protein
VLVWGAFHTANYYGYKHSPDDARTQRRHHTPAGRYTIARPKRAPFSGAVAVAYYAVALGCSVAVPLVVASRRPGDKYLLGEVVYGLIALFAFVVPALTAFFSGRDIPFSTLFATIEHLEDKVRPLAILAGIGITILLIHLAFYPWPAVIRDLQDLHRHNAPTRQHQKQGEPDPLAP